MLVPVFTISLKAFYMGVVDMVNYLSRFISTMFAEMVVRISGNISTLYSYSHTLNNNEFTLLILLSIASIILLINDTFKFGETMSKTMRKVEELERQVEQLKKMERPQDKSEILMEELRRQDEELKNYKKQMRKMERELKKYDYN
jgi:septal ring factor EnvC (AmiA/AmiB activator)